MENGGGNYKTKTNILRSLDCMNNDILVKKIWSWILREDKNAAYHSEVTHDREAIRSIYLQEGDWVDRKNSNSCGQIQIIYISRKKNWRQIIITIYVGNTSERCYSLTLFKMTRGVTNFINAKRMNAKL